MSRKTNAPSHRPPSAHEGNPDADNTTTPGSPSGPCVPTVSDAYWVPDLAHMDTARRQKPWRTDVHHFTSVAVSLSAMVKMFLHSTRGSPDLSQGRFNWFEVMGLLIGHFKHRELILTDSFCLPVSASEVECSMTEASQIYMANYLEYHRQLGKSEPGCVGWYHTHPGYSCFLSGIDVTTQQGSQRMQDPWVALVIDPVETLRSGEFSVKAFRTYPEGYQLNASEEATRPMRAPAAPVTGARAGSALGRSSGNRVKEFGMYAHRYYELPLRVVQSSRDAPMWALLQQHFWPLSLSTSFPFSSCMRRHDGRSGEMMELIATLARQRTESHGYGLSTRHGCVSALSGRHDKVPLLYQSGENMRGVEVSSFIAKENRLSSVGNENECDAPEQLLQIFCEALRDKANSFSLTHAAHPVHPGAREALRIASATVVVPAKGVGEGKRTSMSAQGVFIDFPEDEAFTPELRDRVLTGAGR